MKVFVFVLVVLTAFTLVQCNPRPQEREIRSVMKIEERSIWDQMNAVARLPGDIIRKDFIAFFLDVIIISRFLPLPWIIATFLSLVYKLLKFVHPAYWWLFPSTKPANIQGYGFSKF